MSSETQPINPARFAEALKDLSAENLALKVLELRNSIAHLDYSNAELKPYAEGRAPTLDQQGGQGDTAQPDQDCIDAIIENEAVIARMQERIELIRTEVESRGLSWRELQGKIDDDDATPAATDSSNAETDNLTNGVNGHGPTGETQHPAWRDGTFQTGTLSQLGDEERELLRQLQSRMPPEDDEDPEGGMHL
ncbi:hypothetical protein F5Y00DRAFT_241069 [Daldinia vernicosa]|uniref:uncharacterized protein n=1 Tax=Daldinia vernicosa TaxID=114800 RepID=UPI0020075764|nr:uncharacterized protein F5Y00DRAFT_241069 [Daldinia vernicosa]KAI0847542.1 hypothetical protein F5Y00DRAFT_241069 [Daldinia vernicosa]